MPLDQTFDIRAYISIALRRKWYIVVPLVLSVVIAHIVYNQLPKIYRATTVILVQPQRVPESYVRPTITDSVTSRLSTIAQEILSRTRLETVIQEFNLYADLRSRISMEEIIATMRRAVEVKILSGPQYDRGKNSFSVSYEGKEPETVMMVTNKLASLFIDENLRVREQQAGGTSEFMAKELQEMENTLKTKESEIRSFKERNMGQLPGQLDANLRILEQLQRQLQTTREDIRAAEDRSVFIRNQLEQMRERLIQAGQSRGSSGLGADGLNAEIVPNDPLITRWDALKEELANAQTKYTDSHPDVVNLRTKLAALEPKVKELFEKQKAMEMSRRTGLVRGDEQTGERGPSVAATDPATERLLTQYNEQSHQLQVGLRRLKMEENNLKKEIALYQQRVEDTPKREQEITLLTRDYDLMRTNYQSLLDKNIQSQMAENLERKQQGEQFKVLDPARIPGKPVRPDRNKILIMGLVIGIASGFGLAWFRETLDESFHTVSDVEAYLGLPVVATIPSLKDKSRKAA